MSAEQHLEQALSSLSLRERGEGRSEGPDLLAAALRELVAAWQLVRAPRLAQYIDWLSARLPSAAPDGARWRALAEEKDALALPGLLATLTTVGFREAEERVDRLMPWDDPRISTGLLAMLAAPRFRASGAQWFYERVFKALAARKDPRVPPALRALAARYHEVVTNSYGPVLAKKLVEAAGAMQVDPGEEGALAPQLDALAAFFEHERADASRADGHKAALAAREAELRARALAHPEDDGHFLVWADVLTEQGDPRGELMSLQLFEKKAALAPEQLAQLRLLQSKHRDRLLGAIAHAVVNAVFERGVAVHVELGRDWRGPQAGAAEWAAVRGVTLPERHLGEEWARLLASLPSLRTVMRATPDLLTALHALAPALTLEHVLLEESWNPPPTLALPVAHLATRDLELAGLLRAHEGKSVTLEAAVPVEAVAALEKARARVVRFVDGVHLLDPVGWYGWCCEVDLAERVATVRGRFSGAPDFARLEAWRAALGRLGLREVVLDSSPQRDALYLPLRQVSFA